MAPDKEKIKVLFWRAEFYGAVTDGGVPSLYDGLVKGFLKLGHDVCFVSSGRMKLPPEVKSYYVPYSKLFRNFPEVLNLPYNRKAIKAVKKIIEIEKPDFFFQHHHDFIYAGSIIKRDLGLPFLLHCDSVEQWIKQNWGKLYFKHLLKWAEEIQWAMADAIFVISEEVKKQLIDYGVNESKIIINPNGVHPEIFSPDIDGSAVRERYDLNDKYVIGFSGTFGHWHGVDVLATSIKHIIEKIPNAIVLFIGDGVLRPEIEQIIKSDGVEAHAIITGMLPFEQVPRHLAACDVLVSPCVHNIDDSPFFNSPIKLFEYLGMGKPIVASDIGQQAIVIKDGINGLLCKERSPEDLAEKIFTIYNNPELSENLRNEARRSAVEKYDWKFNAERIIKAYRNVLANKFTAMGR